MILDGLLVFCGSVSTDNVLSGQLVTAVGSTLATNVIDMAPAALGGNQPPDMGQGNRVNVAISILQTLTSAGAATVAFQLVQADDSAMSTNLEAFAQTAAYPFASLAVGKLLPLPWHCLEPFHPRRYVSMQVVIAGGPLTNTGGQFFAYVPSQVVGTMNRYFKSGYTVN